MRVRSLEFGLQGRDSRPVLKLNSELSTLNSSEPEVVCRATPSGLISGPSRCACSSWTCGTGGSRGRRRRRMSTASWTTRSPRPGRSSRRIMRYSTRRTGCGAPRTPAGRREQSGAAAAEVLGIGVDFTSCTMLPCRADGTPLCLLEALPGGAARLAEAVEAPRRQGRDGPDQPGRPRAQRAVAGPVRRDDRAGVVLPQGAGDAERGPRRVRRGGGVARGRRLARLAARRRAVPALQPRHARPLDVPGRLQGDVEREDGLPVAPTTSPPSTRSWPTSSPRKMPGTLAAPGTIGRRADEGRPPRCSGLRPGDARLRGGDRRPRRRAGRRRRGAFDARHGHRHQRLPHDEQPRWSGWCPAWPASSRTASCPGYFGYETGQASVGDALRVGRARPSGNRTRNWRAARRSCRRARAACIALDWLNGCRTPLMDGRLSGAFVGLTLGTPPGAALPRADRGDGVRAAVDRGDDAGRRRARPPLRRQRRPAGQESRCSCRSTPTC